MTLLASFDFFPSLCVVIFLSLDPTAHSRSTGTDSFCQCCHMELACCQISSHTSNAVRLVNHHLVGCNNVLSYCIAHLRYKVDHVSCSQNKKQLSGVTLTCQTPSQRTSSFSRGATTSGTVDSYSQVHFSYDLLTHLPPSQNCASCC